MKIIKIKMKMNKKYSKIQTFKELLAIITGSILLFGGLGVMLSAELLNGVIIISILMMSAGIACFVYIAKGILREKE